MTVIAPEAINAKKVTLVLPEPPSLNAMLDLAKQRTRRSRTGGFMRRSLPVVYDQQLELYELQCLAALRSQRIAPPASPWPQWTLETAHFSLFNLRDPVELLASLKWPVDALVRLRFVAGDSPRELLSVPIPSQAINRANRRVVLTIAAAA